MRNGFCDVVEMLTGGCCKSVALHRGILVLGDALLLGRRSGRTSLSSYMVQCGDLDCHEVVEGGCINISDASNDLGDLGQDRGCLVPEIGLVGCGWSALGRGRGRDFYLHTRPTLPFGSHWEHCLRASTASRSTSSAGLPSKEVGSSCTTAYPSSAHLSKGDGAPS